MCVCVCAFIVCVCVCALVVEAKLQLLPLLTFLGVVKFWLQLGLVVHIAQFLYTTITVFSYLVLMVSWYGVIPVGM